MASRYQPRSRHTRHSEIAEADRDPAEKRRYALRPR